MAAALVLIWSQGLPSSGRTGRLGVRMGFANRDEFDELDDFDDDEDEPGSFGRGWPASRYPPAGYSPPVEGAGPAGAAFCSP